MQQFTVGHRFVYAAAGEPGFQVLQGIVPPQNESQLLLCKSIQFLFFMELFSVMGAVLSNARLSFYKALVDGFPPFLCLYKNKTKP